MSMIIRNQQIGQGQPKICVPITGKTLDRVLESAESAVAQGAELLEWRADGYQGELLPVLQQLRQAAGEIPLLITLRSIREGGVADLSWEDYERFYRQVADSGLADLADIEYSWGEEQILPLIHDLREKNLAVIVSRHFWDGMPESGELLMLYQRMSFVGGDFRKVAVMPRNAEDVLRLFRVSMKAQQTDPARPVISIGMGALGKITRMSGELFSSAVTYASDQKATAPGQIPVAEMKIILDLLSLE